MDEVASPLGLMTDNHNSDAICQKTLDSGHQPIAALGVESRQGFIENYNVEISSE
jgi:hypothetical protein